MCAVGKYLQHLMCPAMQIAFIDLAELAALSRKLGCNADMEWEALPPEAPQ